MAQHDQQPEEALTKLPAAAAQGAGAFAQARMYGSAMRGRNQLQRTGPGTPAETGSTARPAASPAEPDLASTLTLADDPGLGRLIERWDPLEHATRLAAEPGEPWPPPAPPEPTRLQPGEWTWPDPTSDETPAPGAEETERPAGPVTEDADPVLTGAELDSAAAQDRLQVGQVEPPPIPLPGPGIGPGAV